MQLKGCSLGKQREKRSREVSEVGAHFQQAANPHRVVSVVQWRHANVQGKSYRAMEACSKVPESK